MNHQEATDLLIDYVAGRLSAPEREEISRHLDSCTECRGLVETLQVLSRPSLKRDTNRGPPGHPTSTDIVEYVQELDELSVPERERLEAHFNACDSCALEVQMVQQAEKDAGATPPFPGRTAQVAKRQSSYRLWPRLALAAAAIGAAGTAYLGLYRLPRLQSKVAALEAETREIVMGEQQPMQRNPNTSATSQGSVIGSGFVHIHTLQMPRRDTTRTQTIALGAEEETLYVSIESPDLREESGSRWRFVLVDALDKVLWSQEATRREIERIGPEIVLAIPARSLPSGVIRLQMRDAGSTGEAHFSIPMKLERRKANDGANPGN